MTLIGKSSHAMFFNGISDGILVPQAPFSKTGTQTTHGKSYDATLGGQGQNVNTKMSKTSESFSVEAWVVPDCGGVIASKEGVFELRIGDISTPGPAQFTVHTYDENVGKQSVTATTASPVIVSGAHKGWDGIVYPTDASVALQGTFNRFNTGKTDESALNRNSRELIYIVGVFTGQQVKLYVNGELVASEKLQRKTRSAHSSANLYIGGKGGEYRGRIEGVHWRRGFAESNAIPSSLLPNTDTIGLWRFEEPIDVPDISLTLKSAASASTSASGSTLTISNADGKALMEYITGSTPTATTTLDLASSTYSNGKYQITTAGALQQPDHLPINLIINPTGVDEKTGIAYQTSPPERVRLKQVVWNADGTTDSTLTVYSIHLDFSNSTTTGLRGLLHAHAANDTTNQLAKGSTIAVINSDLLIDSGSGLPLRAPGQGTQIIDRTGQMVIDEVGGNHGFIFNTQIATDTTNNPFAFNWGATELPVGFQAGHTGRHKFTHITGHPYLQHLPEATEEIVERNLDGDSDSFTAFYEGSALGLRRQVPLGSLMDVHRQAFVGSAINVENTGTVVEAVENGLAGFDTTARQLIAIGGEGFDPIPFLLKGHAFLGEDGTTDTYDMHLTPEDTSRVAILECAMGSDAAPYVEIHYNAIDLDGSRIQYAATGTTSAAWDNTNHRITLTNNGTKAFGPNSGTFDGYHLICDGERAYDSKGTVTFTIDHTNHRLNATSGGSSVRTAFEGKIAAAGAIVYLELTGAALCVTKTVPDASSIISGTQVIDYIHTALASGATLHAPGGVVTISDDVLGAGSVAFQNHRMVGDNTGGTTYEMELDNTLIPANHVPNSATDTPQSPPKGIVASHVIDATHSPVYHKMVIRNSQSGTSGSAAGNSSDPAITNAPDIFRLSPRKEATSNANGVFDTPATNHATNLFEVFDIIDNWQVGKNHVLIVQPTDRTRTMQLTKFASESTQSNDPNFLSVEFLQCRGRVQDFREKTDDKGRQLIIRGLGLVHDIRDANASLLGDGSPDSHGVKEIIPGGPVVAVSLGGPGQGALDTKPTYDPSPMARIGWNTRRPCAAVVNTVDVSSTPRTITLSPYNNQSKHLASWGHICFPPSSGSSGSNDARVYLKTGASAAYYDIVAGEILFDTTDTNMAGWFVNADGSLESTFADWVTTNVLPAGTILYTDPYIGDDTMSEDGTTVQDRMFQKLSSVTHDYQLGTQYASTRALVEIPFFPHQFFEDAEEGIFPGPNNSMKLTLDATMTAHTWNPKPVGRRLCDSSIAADPTVLGPYTRNWITSGLRDTSIVSVTYVSASSPAPAHWLFEVDDASIFPQAMEGLITSASASGLGRAGIAKGGAVSRTRRFFLPDGSWAIYDRVDYTNNTIRVNDLLSGYGIRTTDSGGHTTNSKTNENNAIGFGMGKTKGGHTWRPLYGEWQTNRESRQDGEWVIQPITSPEMIGKRISPTAHIFNGDIPSINDGEGYSVAEAQSFTSPFYHDQASVLTQGSGLDYGLKQYVSAVEFKAGPEENPHTAKLQTGAWRGKILSYKNNVLIVDNAENFPPIGAMLRYGSQSVLDWKVRNENTGLELQINYLATTTSISEPVFSAKVWSSSATAVLGTHFKIGDELTIMSLEVNPNTGGYATTWPKVMHDAILNKEWLGPYASGGLRNGDTIWMNMHYTNPHATDGIFCKSRGVVNDWEVHSMFNGGLGQFDLRSRNSIPMENFLIGNTCRETAENYVQHVNKTIEQNLIQLGIHTTRTVAFLDPYLCTDDHARVLLYDVEADRECVAFHDLYMQVQSSPDAVKIDNMDAANGFISQRRDVDISGWLSTSQEQDYPHDHTDHVKIRSDHGKSSYIEGAYSHSDGVTMNVERLSQDDSETAIARWAIDDRYNRNYEEYAKQGDCTSRYAVPRTTDGVCCYTQAELWFGQGIEDAKEAAAFWASKSVTGVTSTTTVAAAGGTGSQSFDDSTTAIQFNSHTLDTPNGTRTISAFLCLKGIRAVDSPTTNARLSNLPHWKQMDFTRRLTIDLGEIGIKEGVTSVEAAAHEIVRLINQAGAKKGRSNIRRPVDQFPGATVGQDDGASAHIKADYAVTGSTHDPASFWDDTAFSSYDRGSHMGYLRAHIGRVIEDRNGVEGYTIVIHSTIPGATGRNFCVWLDNSKGQTNYNPQFLIGHGGRFNSFYCQPLETAGENMHPAPMPINKHGRPFAPITTLQQFVSTGVPSSANAQLNRAIPPTPFTAQEQEGALPALPSFGAAGGGVGSNSVTMESTMPTEMTVVEGLGVGTKAYAQMNFGGLVASGVPGWSPDYGTWGFGDGTDSRAHNIYSASAATQQDYTSHVPATDKLEIGTDGQIYGIQFEDHLKRKHTVRMLYKEYGKTFTNENTNLPSTIENEIVIWMDDRDVSFGGFTIGRAMKGAGDIGKRIKTGAAWKLDTNAYDGAVTESKAAYTDAITDVPYCGGRWNGVPSPMAAYAVTIDRPSGTSLSLRHNQGDTFAWNKLHGGIWHDLPADGDVLGFLGFPKTNGVLQLTLPEGNSGGAAADIGSTGYMISYTHRTENTKFGPHTFYGCTGIPTALSGWGDTTIGPDTYEVAESPACISARPNWTTLVTDELIAAAVEFALTMDDPNEGDTFDCTNMLAADGRTFGEWGISPSAIRVQAYSDKHPITPLRTLFNVRREKDYGILHAHANAPQKTVDGVAIHAAGASHANAHLWYNESYPLNLTEGTNSTPAYASPRGMTNTALDGNMGVPCGYVPRTVLHISTRYRGANANTVSPLVVDSRNVPINTDTWQQNLRGELCQFWAGDHILPMINNGRVELSVSSSSDDANGTFTNGGHSSTGKWAIKLSTINGGGGTSSNEIQELFQFGPVGRIKNENMGMITAGAHGDHLPFGGAEDASYVAPYTMWCSNSDWAVITPKASQADAKASGGPTNLFDSGYRDGGYQWRHQFARINVLDDLSVLASGVTANESEEFTARCDATIAANEIIYLQRWLNPEHEGIRTSGSYAYAKPITYFRGASDGSDHSVPLYFGGGFSGAVLDINDGTENDYTEFYTHPYSAGPTGCAGIQNANEIMGSHCILDTTAMLAMFPGTGYLDQHKGQANPPFQNEHLQLSPDMALEDSHVPITTASSQGPDGSTGAAGYTNNSKTVIQTQPSPIILRFAHPFARYEDVQDDAKKTQTTYVVFGPGQSVPTFLQSNYTNSPSPTTYIEPSVAISVGCLYNKYLFANYGSDRSGFNPVGVGRYIPAYPYAPMASGLLAYYGTPDYAYLPNGVDLGKTTTWDNAPKTGSSSTTKSGWDAKIGWLPPTKDYQQDNVTRWQGVDNWEPAQGDPNADQYNQYDRYGLHLSGHFNRHDYGEDSNHDPASGTWSYGSTGYAHPLSPLTQTIYNGSGERLAGPIEDAAAIDEVSSRKIYTATAKDYAWHMDGGHPPGANFLDDRVVRNPQNGGAAQYCYAYHQISDGTYTPSEFRVGDNATMFRIGAAMLKQLTDGWGYTQDNHTTGVEGHVDRDIIVIDATRVQNAEELATVMSCAINEWPGTGALKALGGTFLPSFQSAHKQDRYSWVELPMDPTAGNSGLNGRTDHLTFESTAINTDYVHRDHFSIGIANLNPYTRATVTTYVPYELPVTGSGRLFLDSDTNPAVKRYVGADTGADTVSSMNDRGFYFFYAGISNSDDTSQGGGTVATAAHRSFYLAQNYRTGLRLPEDPTVDCTNRTFSSGMTGAQRPGMKYMECAVQAVTAAIPNPLVGFPRIMVWTKTGNHRWNNGGFNTANATKTNTDRSRLGLDTTTSLIFHALACTHVHFNGLHDAVDRTRPIGAVGWAGNQYSMLNSMGYWEPSLGVFAVPRGLGAWHPYLSFNPYGHQMGCHDSNYIGQYQASNVFADGDNAANYGIGGMNATDASAHWSYSNGWSTTYPTAKGTHENHYVVITHESELPLVARADHLGINGVGDLLSGIWKTSAMGTTSPPGKAANNDPNSIPPTGTTAWSADIHAPSRYSAPANGGPYVEAQVPATLENPTTNDTKRTNMQWGAKVDGADDLIMADACAAPTGDLFVGTDWVGHANTYYSDVNGIGGARANALPGIFDADTEPQRYWHDPVSNAGKVGGRNFTVEHVVWKRMDGGNLSLPAPNARGLGALPWVWRKQSGTSNYYKTGETVYGNCRFSFETTNSAMLPVIQAQELSHPQLAELYPFEIGNAMTIPNEEIQFESITVIDDTGQEHRIEGGSPFGTIIRDFKSISDRTDEGMAPALAGSGSYPNMEIQLPDPDTIPGNIIVRSGFDRVQSYQNETVGTGGLQHPSQPTNLVDKAFDGSGPTDALWPTWENNKWEQVAQDSTFPQSVTSNWANSTDDAPLKTAYEPHDRTLYFHITKHDISYSKREPVAAINHIHQTALGGGATNLVLRDNITVNQTTFTGTTLTYGGTVHFHATHKGAIFADPREQLKDGSNRWYLVAINSAGKKAIASYTGVTTGSARFDGVVFDSNWDETFNGADIYPSFYTPAGSARLFAARRMRDHAEVSGNSPDMPRVAWWKLNDGGPTSTNPYDLINAPKLTPMPIPRMGHHYVTPTMAMMPGHLAHPVYQNIWKSHLAVESSTRAPVEMSGNVGGTPTMDPNIWFSNLTPNYPPSDIHGGAFTLMSETKVRFDGYGVLASNGVAGDVNSKGGHVIILESNSHYTQTSHFPDPLEVGAYQIVIQPNLFSQQVTGFHQNTPFADTTSPRNAADSAYESDLEQNLTGQQVATVVGIFHDWATYGATGLVLADALSADVRGCEVYLNEIMLDIDPAAGQQFTSLPPLATFNALGVNESTSPAFSRRSMPYHPTMFKRATPGYTLTIPWWAIGMNSGMHSGLSLIGVDDYYQFCRATYGAISAQITLAGYPSYFFDPYQREHQSLNPQCTVTTNPTAGATATVRVDDNSLFPLDGSIYNRLLMTIDATGQKHYATYATRGTSGMAATGDTDRFLTVTPADGLGASSPIWNALTTTHALYNGGVLHLTGPHHNYERGALFTDTRISPLTRILPQVLSGSRDTNNLFMADAYLCMWHHNLGRPFTAFSEGRTTAGSPTHQKPYNIMPESFEMVHYHEFAYAISTGPFALGMKWMNHRIASDTSTGTWDNANHRITLTNSPVTSGYGADGGTFDGYYLMIDGIRAYHEVGTVTFTIDDGNKRLNATGGGASVSTVFEGLVAASAVVELIMDDGTNAAIAASSAVSAPVTMPSGGKHFFGGFWPGGSRYGAGASRLDMWGDVERGWNAASNPFDGSCVAYAAQYNAGPTLDPMEIRSDQTVTSTWTNYNTTPHNGAPWTRNYCFGYRFAVRQPYNRPRWAIAIKSVAEGPSASGTYAATGHFAYYNGPFVQNESGSWTSGAETAVGTTSIASGISGILERQTNASHLLGFDIPGWQVRYSDGRRMTRPFGCPVRTLRNHGLSRRQFPGDSAGLAIEDVVKANMYYVVDWWGNTTGEDVRRFPVRGFGLRPAFDPEAWRWTAPGTGGNIIQRPESLFHLHSNASMPPSVQEGNRNETNNNEYSATMADRRLTDLFNPLDSIRVGDRGDGRGVRCPIFFNEYVAQAVNTTINPLGLMLSHHTAEPPFTQGLIRARDDTLQGTEIPRGISSRMGIADAAGLLKKEGTSGRNLEESSGVFGMEGLSFQDPVSRMSPRIGLDTLTVGEMMGQASKDYIIQATQAISLHTDREVGQRYIFEGSFKHTMFPRLAADGEDDVSETTQALGHLDFSKAASMTWADPPSILRFNNAHGVSPLGGNYIMEVSSYSEPFDDTGWGIDGTVSLGSSGPTSNPYQGNTASSNLNNPMSRRTNALDTTVRFLVRPYRVLDYRHVALFRPVAEPVAGTPQALSTKPFFKHTAGSRYGLFNYEMANGRAGLNVYVSTTNPSPTTAPYVASYIPNQSNYSDNKSHGPKIQGASVLNASGVVPTPTLGTPVARLLISENTLQHYRSDASRRRTISEENDIVIRPDYSVQPRYSQSLHPKGEGGTTDFNTGDHDDDTPDDYSGVRTVDY